MSNHRAEATTTSRLRTAPGLLLAGIAIIVAILSLVVSLNRTQNKADVAEETAKTEKVEKNQAVSESEALRTALREQCESGIASACHQLSGLPENPVVRDDEDPNDPEIQEPEIQEPEVQESEFDNPETQEIERQDPEIQDPELADPEEQDAEEQESEIQDSEEQESEVQEPEIQDDEIQDPEIDDPDPNSALTYAFTGCEPREAQYVSGMTGEWVREGSVITLVLSCSYGELPAIPVVPPNGITIK